MEKNGYRETLEMLLTRFPGRVTVSPSEVADVLDVNIKTVYAAINRSRNPLPSTRLSKKKVLIPISRLANWMC